MSTSFDEKWTRKKIKRCRQRENLFSATTPHYIRMKHCGLQFFLSVLSSLFVKNDEVEENFNASLIPGFSSFSWCVFFFKTSYTDSFGIPQRIYRGGDGGALCGLGAAMKNGALLRYGLVISCVYHCTICYSSTAAVVFAGWMVFFFFFF